MKQLVLTFYAEGSSDYRFLPIIVQRTADRILRYAAVAPVEVLQPIVITPDPTAATHEQRILSVAQQAAGSHALVLHYDADSPVADSAYQNRFSSDCRSIQECAQDVCRDLVPVIPVRMTEAWILADVEAFKGVVGTELSAQELGFPRQPHQVEAILDPKSTLKSALSRVFSRRRRAKKASAPQYYETLSRRISLDNLERVPAFAQFMGDLRSLLQRLQFAR